MCSSSGVVRKIFFSGEDGGCKMTFERFGSVNELSARLIEDQQGRKCQRTPLPARVGLVDRKVYLAQHGLDTEPCCGCSSHRGSQMGAFCAPCLYAIKIPSVRSWNGARMSGTTKMIGKDSQRAMPIKIHDRTWYRKLLSPA